MTAAHKDELRSVVQALPRPRPYRPAFDGGRVPRAWSRLPHSQSSASDWDCRSLGRLTRTRRPNGWCLGGRYTPQTGCPAPRSGLAGPPHSVPARASPRERAAADGRRVESEEEEAAWPPSPEPSVKDNRLCEVGLGLSGHVPRTWPESTAGRSDAQSGVQLTHCCRSSGRNPDLWSCAPASSSGRPARLGVLRTRGGARVPERR